ncbi:hypothetical protein U9M48_011989 [Paspalum notatum var. saurae]|uniref:Reverse transcriptase n=1 Tax=Paspalum notatum var. saurae TaxID=547442 RepID=A0AAQ3SY59_PASNO
MPLTCRPLRRVDFLPLLDKLAGQLLAWKGKLLDKAGRLTLVNSVLTAVPVHFLTVFPLKKWAIKKIDKIRRWLWLNRTDSNRPWAGSHIPCAKIDAALFRASTSVTVGNGLKTKFWHDAWPSGKALIDIAPRLYPLAWRKNKSVAEQLVNLNWMRGLWRMEKCATDG